MNFEDELRETMRAHDDQAPRADGLPERPWAKRRTWLPIAAAAAAVLVIAIGVFTLTQTRTNTSHQTSSISTAKCPERYPKTVRPWVPAQPNGVDDRARLVPNERPAHVLVCAYLGNDRGALTGSRSVMGNLDAVAGSLAWVSPGHPDSGICDLVLRPGDRDDYLIWLAYDGGGLWVSAPGDHCVGASNGEFGTMNNLAAFAKAAYQSGAWNPAPKLDYPAPRRDACSVSPLGRLGQEQKLVPGSPIQLTVCARTGAHFDRYTITHLTDLVAALNRLPTSKFAYTSHCPAGGPGTTYELWFRYPEGPDAVIEVLPGCQPALDNFSLQADDASTIVPLIQQLLDHPK